MAFEITYMAAVLNALNQARQIAEGALSLRDKTKLLETVNELNRKIFDANKLAFEASVAQEGLLQEKRMLEAKIAEFERFDAEKVKYDLQEVVPGAFAYARKPGAEPPEPVHWACPTCYANRKIRILQQEQRGTNTISTVLMCHECGTDIYKSGLRQKDRATKAGGTFGRG